MLKWAGALLLAGGCTAAGMQAAARLTRRLTVIESWQTAVSQMAAELRCRNSALPDLVAQLARGGPLPLKSQFEVLAAKLKAPGDRRYAEVWRVWAMALPLGGEEREVVASVGEVLGRYELDSQLSALEGVSARLAQCQQRARGRRERLAKLYAMSGALGGLAAVIVLL